MTCCGLIGLILALALTAAGIAMIIYARILPSSCGDVCNPLNRIPGSEVSSCSNACSTVVYDILFYGGIGVAVLGAVAVLWRLMCCCSR